ncbi:hypothetical protein SCHPADRAFT_569380 [Schizopora paradoxa]|uniref:Uncharacterized protein n=1 Tax=Schizopora paradoxa TaxID=27342 RepID=A0A0H2RX13_9AGAM|nr:hypothetical protein SCHPADRAFT_569380 [Schizopora paradoxa]
MAPFPPPSSTSSSSELFGFTHRIRPLRLIRLLSHLLRRASSAVNGGGGSVCIEWHWQRRTVDVWVEEEPEARVRLSDPTCERARIHEWRTLCTAYARSHRREDGGSQMAVRFPGCETSCSRQDNLQQQTHETNDLFPPATASTSPPVLVVPPSASARAAIQRAIHPTRHGRRELRDTRHGSNPNPNSNPNAIANAALATAQAAQMGMSVAPLAPPPLALAHVHAHPPPHAPPPPPRLEDRGRGARASILSRAER